MSEPGSARETGQTQRQRVDAADVAAQDWRRGCQEARKNERTLTAELAAVRQRETQLHEAVIQARRDLWWFVERGTAEGEWGFDESDAGEIVPRAMRIQDDVLGAVLADTSPPTLTEPAGGAGVVSDR